MMDQIADTLAYRFLPQSISQLELPPPPLLPLSKQATRFMNEPSENPARLVQKAGAFILKAYDS